MKKLALLYALAVLPGWMSGAWRASGASGTTEEVWSTADGTLMTGMHRSVREGRKTWFEFLRIEQRGESLVYLAMPGGRAPATEFAATSIEARKIVFENPQHDFPKRITYWRDGKRLCARVDDGGAKAQQWCWEKVPH